MSQTLESQWDREPLTIDSLVPTVMLRHHLGRVHIGTSDLDVARDTWSAIKQAPNQEAWTREIRRQTLAAALWLHAENRAEYAHVMSGRF
jgi:hypothetical protein